MTLRLSVFKQAAVQWSKHNAPRLGAALAYYTILSLAPLLVVIVAIAGYAFGEEAVRGHIYWQIKDLIGSESAVVVQTLLKAAHRPAAGVWATIIGFAVLLAGASGVFLELRDTLNYIWEVPVKEGGGFMTILRYRFFSFALVLGIGFLMMVSLALSALIQAAGTLASQHISIPPPVLEGINIVVTFLVTSFLFALIYRIIPEAPIEWEDVITGSVVTSALFAAGKFLIGLYIGKAGVGSAYGAAGSAIVLLVWVYYSSQIFLYGAEFTHVYAQRRGSRATRIRRAKVPRDPDPTRKGAA